MCMFLIWKVVFANSCPFQLLAILCISYHDNMLEFNMDSPNLHNIRSILNLNPKDQNYE